MPRERNAVAGRAAVEGSSPRRTALVQNRSRETRRKLIRAALELWNERGFDEAFESTTAEEIARFAGVSKGTFYFHFAHKDDILLEMSWATADLMREEATAAMDRAEPTFALVERLMTTLAARVSQAPRAAVLRATSHWSRLVHAGLVLPTGGQDFSQVFESVVRYAISQGDLPMEAEAEAEVAELGAHFRAATMDALERWSATDQSSAALRQSLCRRADVILRGAAASYQR